MNRIKELRQQHHMTQEELGIHLGVGQTTVSAWELGRNEPKGEHLYWMARMYNVSIEYLLGFEDIKENKAMLVKWWDESGMHSTTSVYRIQSTAKYIELYSTSGKFLAGFPINCRFQVFWF